ARATLPGITQVVVPAQGRSRLEFDRRLLLARRRMEIRAAAEELSGFGVASASSRTVVYKGLIAGGRLADFYRDLAQPGLALSHAVFHQRYATNTSPTWGLAQPFRLIAHNGEINTVRGNREQLRGRRARLGGAFGRQLAALGPILSDGG